MLSDVTHKEGRWWYVIVSSNRSTLNPADYNARVEKVERDLKKPGQRPRRPPAKRPRLDEQRAVERPCQGGRKDWQHGRRSAKIAFRLRVICIKGNTFAAASVAFTTRPSVIITDRLSANGVSFGDQQETPSHKGLPKLIKLHLTVEGKAKADCVAIIRCLYEARIAADYQRRTNGRHDRS